MAAILNVRFGLRSRLSKTAYHTSTVAIPKEELTPEKEPGLAPLIAELAATIAADPDLILVDSYTAAERAADWRALVKREVLGETGEVMAIDARSRPGHKLLDHHMRHFYDVANHTGRSVRQLATDTAALQKALMANVAMHSTPYKSEIRRMLTLTAGMSNVTKYRTVTAKAIVSHFGAKRVLDPCVGWGGRMLGSLAAAGDVTYTGFEPEPRTAAGLLGILGDLPASVASRASVTAVPAEVGLAALADAALQYDMILTSPPYYNLEIYSDTDTAQSTVTHPTWEDWCENWLRPVILAALERLTATGTSCWSVKNIRTDHVYPLAKVVHDIHVTAGWKLVKTVAMTGSARPGVGRIVDGKEQRGSEEETFCFKRV
jgi:hypothetical protein